MMPRATADHLTSKFNCISLARSRLVDMEIQCVMKGRSFYHWQSNPYAIMFPSRRKASSAAARSFSFTKR
jgi:hypothetical protein